MDETLRELYELLKWGPTAFNAQNGAVIHENTAISVTGCAKAKSLTRAQKLSKALKACKKKAKDKHAATREAGRMLKHALPHIVAAWMPTWRIPGQCSCLAPAPARDKSADDAIPIAPSKTQIVSHPCCRAPHGARCS